MFNSIKKYFRKEMPEFNSLKTFPHKDHYFYRVAQWDWLTEKQITIYDPHAPRLITLDDWPQLVFLDAKGKLTVTEYVDYIAAQYSSKIPQKLDATIINQLNTLAEQKLIEYAETEKELETRFDGPMSSQKTSS